MATDRRQTSGMTRNPKGGRPPLPFDQRADAVVSCRVSLFEKERIRTEAIAAGLKPSDYLRKVITERKVVFQASPDPEASVARIRANHALASELNRIGVNVNQLARATHRGAEFTRYWRDVGAEVERLLAKAAGALDPE